MSKTLTSCPFFLLVLLLCFAQDFVVCWHAVSAPAHGFPALHPGVHVHVFLKGTKPEAFHLCSHSIIMQPHCTFQALLFVLRHGHTHLHCVYGPHAKSLHLTVLPDAADVVHFLKDSLSSATHTSTQNDKLKAPLQ